jgi:hypothetical protein
MHEAFTFKIDNLISFSIFIQLDLICREFSELITQDILKVVNYLMCQ